jgi:hypothetical protein
MLIALFLTKYPASPYLEGKEMAEKQPQGKSENKKEKIS